MKSVRCGRGAFYFGYAGGHASEIAPPGCFFAEYPFSSWKPPEGRFEKAGQRSGQANCEFLFYFKE